VTEQEKNGSATGNNRVINDLVKCIVIFVLVCLCPHIHANLFMLFHSRVTFLFHAPLSASNSANVKKTIRTSY